MFYTSKVKRNIVWSSSGLSSHPTAVLEKCLQQWLQAHTTHQCRWLWSEVQRNTLYKYK